MPQESGWSVGLRLLIGPSGDQGEESFDLTVCDVDWITQQIQVDGVVDGRHTLMVDGFHWPTLMSFFERRVASVNADTWTELASKLGRLGYWEFEDYRP